MPIHLFPKRGYTLKESTVPNPKFMDRFMIEPPIKSTGVEGNVRVYTDPATGVMTRTDAVVPPRDRLGRPFNSCT